MSPGFFDVGGIRILLFYVSSFFGCVITQKLICVVEKRKGSLVEHIRFVT